MIKLFSLSQIMQSLAGHCWAVQPHLFQHQYYSCMLENWDGPGDEAI